MGDVSITAALAIAFMLFGTIVGLRLYEQKTLALIERLAVVERACGTLDSMDLEGVYLGDTK